MAYVTSRARDDAIFHYRMRQSTLFTKTRREAPKDEVSKNAQLLIRAGYIHKEMAGVYDYLPLGLRTFNNIVDVIRDEMNALGGQEVVMTTLQDPEPWKESGRWSDDVVDIWFKTALTNGTEVGIANTHEEPLTRLLANHVHSHKDLPKYIYQFQTKFRNELRAKSGLMRTREFVMKDMYSFNRSEEEFREFYERAAEAYHRIFARLGLGDRTFRAIAAGGSFTSGYTDEFQTVSDAGEDVIYIHDEKKIAVNKEVLTDDVLAGLDISRDELREAKSIEVGNIFPLGTKYAEAMNLTFTDTDGTDKSPVMGSYGIGPGRLMGAVVETFADDDGIVWPEEIAPFRFHIVPIGDTDETRHAADTLYEDLTAAGMSVLYDDRAASTGEKLADADLIGIPYRIVVSEKARAAGGHEVRMRATGDTRVLPSADITAL